MASKKPKAIYVPTPVAPVSTTPPEPTADELRVHNILTRKRGRLGTIGSSLRGVLSDTNIFAPIRKTLLGE